MRAITITLLTLLPASVAAWEQNFQGRGAVGLGADRCWFDQTLVRDDPLFFVKAFDHMDGMSYFVMEFDDPKCLGRGDIDDMYWLHTRIANMYIGNVFRRDMKFDRTNLRTRSEYQDVGECMASTNYPSKSIWVRHVIEGDAVRKVLHTQGIGSCPE